jgi:hypothetical protein
MITAWGRNHSRQKRSFSSRALRSCALISVWVAVTAFSTGGYGLADAHHSRGVTLTEAGADYQLGLPQFGEMQCTFSGGEHADVQRAFDFCLWREAGVGQHARNVRDATSCGHICSKLTGTVSASRELNAPLKKTYACRRRQAFHRWCFLGFPISTFGFSVTYSSGTKAMRMPQPAWTRSSHPNSLRDSSSLSI